MLYTGVIEVEVDGSASGWFPDVPRCIFAGDSFADAYNNAKSALKVHFELLAEKGLDIPKASDQHLLDYAKVKPNLKNVLVDVDIDITKYFGKSERINITMPHLLIEKIYQAVSQDSRYSSRSHFIAEATRKELSNRQSFLPSSQGRSVFGAPTHALVRARLVSHADFSC